MGLWHGEAQRQEQILDLVSAITSAPKSPGRPPSSAIKVRTESGGEKVELVIVTVG